MTISDIPEKWVIIKIDGPIGTFYKVFSTWAGGYLGTDKWKLNSGIDKVNTDDEYYYFIGFSGSCYKCHKKTYGLATQFGFRVLNNIVEKSDRKISVLEDKPDWESFFNLINNF